jgi:hypothetical protein
MKEKRCDDQFFRKMVDGSEAADIADYLKAYRAEGYEV